MQVFCEHRCEPCLNLRSPYQPSVPRKLHFHSHFKKSITYFYKILIEYYIQVARLYVMISFFILFGLIGTSVNANSTNELLVHLVSSNDTCIDVNMMATSNGCKDFSNTDTLWVIEEEIIVTNEVDGEYFMYMEIQSMIILKQKVFCLPSK